MMESTRRHFRRRSDEQGSKELRSPTPNYGFISIGNIRKDGETRTLITRNHIWAGDGFGSYKGTVKGEIASNIKGLIETTYPPITLSIKKPTAEPESLSSDKRIRSFQEIGNIAEITRGDINLLRKFSRRDAAERDDLQGQIAELNLRLKTLRVDQSNEAQKLLADASRKKVLLEQQAQESLKNLQEEKEKFPSYDNALRIKSHNGDITLNVEDPRVAISIALEYNHRDTEPQITGRPPENPERVIEVFTYRGKIAIKYPQR